MSVHSERTAEQGAATATERGVSPPEVRTWKAIAQALVARYRYWIPVAVVGFGSAVIGFFWWLHTGDATRQVMMCWYILPGIPFLLLLWWVFLSGLRWKVRIGGVGLLAASALVFFTFFRFKDFSGDMVPRWEYRWQPSSEDKASGYWSALGPSAAPAANSGTTHATAPSQEIKVTAADSPQLGGTHRDQHVRGVAITADWSQRPPKQLWRHPVGAAWSSFAVVGDLVWTQEQRGPDEAVVCYDASTGKQLWAHLDRDVRFSSAMGGLGPRATPTGFDSRLYTFGATGILNCLDPTTGSVLWSTNALTDAGVTPLQFGMSSSPLVYDNVVVVNPGGTRMNLADNGGTDHALTAYDRKSGNQVWSAGNYQAAYASPILATIGGVRQIVIFDGLGVAGHDASNGKELWRSPEWTNTFHNNIAQPIVTPEGNVFASSGYGTGSLLLDVKHAGSDWTATPIWRAPNQFKLKFNSGVYRDGCVYGLDEGILACFDLKTGKQRWKKGRYKYGQILLLDDALFVLSEDGDGVLVEISPAGSRELSKFHAIDGKTWNVPAISRGRLFVRNAEEAACFSLGGESTAMR